MPIIACPIKTSYEYLALKDKSGIHTEFLDSLISAHLSKHGTYPQLDELCGVDSSLHLKLLFKNKNYVLLKLILLLTGTQSLKEANAKLNNIYKDLEIKLLLVGDIVLIKYRNRPNEYTRLPEEKPEEINISNNVLFDLIISKLLDYYGIPIKRVTMSDLESGDFNNLHEDFKMSKAFVYNGEIYINTDIATADSPIHEFGHILVGNLRFYNPSLYLQLISLAEQLPKYYQLLSRFTNRSRNDVNEEIFILELSKHLVGIKSVLDNMTELQEYLLNYGIKRILDSILSGTNSVKSIPDNVLYTNSLQTVAKLVNSELFTYKPVIDYSITHRKLSNLKLELLKTNKLKEIC